jgi:Spy/CpxP family protein refolding chaperone
MKGAIALTLLMSTSLAGCIYVEKQPEIQQDSGGIDIQKEMEKELDSQRRQREQLSEDFANQAGEIMKENQERQTELYKEMLRPNYVPQQ